jgi:hypothetical protein
MMFSRVVGGNIQIGLLVKDGIAELFPGKN